MKISKESAVSVHYHLTLGSSEGETIEETYGGEPLKFIFGIGQMIPGFEENLDGMQSGDKFGFLLEPGEAYGDSDPNAIIKVSKEQFQDESGEIQEEFLQLGFPISMQDQQGNSFQGVVEEVMEDIIVVNFNHPMAGKSLYFKGEVMDVRPATETELDHGHIHE